MNENSHGNWYRIWSKRELPELPEGSILQKLISMDGFDSPLGMMKEQEWREYVDLFSHRAGIERADSIFEVGCGTGAFLYVFHSLGHQVGGIDYSDELIEVARSVMPERKSFLNTLEASRCPVKPQASVVVANHVVHYFPSIDYSAGVLEAMLDKAERVVAISGIPDAELKHESERARRGLLTAEDYEEKYRGLDIIYYQKDWLSDLAKRRNFSVNYFPHEMPGFAQNQFRFDCVMTRE